MMIREVAERDPHNMYAQFMLGMGAMMSGQFDKAIERLIMVTTNQPENLEVMLCLQKLTNRKGDKTQCGEMV